VESVWAGSGAECGFVRVGRSPGVAPGVAGTGLGGLVQRLAGVWLFGALLALFWGTVGPRTVPGGRLLLGVSGAPARGVSTAGAAGAKCLVAGGEVFAGGDRFRGLQFGHLRMGRAPHAVGGVPQREAGVGIFIKIRPFFCENALSPR